MGTKLSHIGMSGHLAVMSELLRLGYNTLLPLVDVGEDVFIIDDEEGDLTAKIQVKTSTPAPHKSGLAVSGVYQIPREQLNSGKRVTLYYAFALLPDKEWDFVLIPREELLRIRIVFEQSTPTFASSETNKLTLTFTEQDVTGWGQSLQSYRGAFERYFPRVTSGPGSRPTALDT